MAHVDPDAIARSTLKALADLIASCDSANQPSSDTALLFRSLLDQCSSERAVPENLAEELAEIKRLVSRLHTVQAFTPERQRYDPNPR